MPRRGSHRLGNLTCAVLNGPAHRGNTSCPPIANSGLARPISTTPPVTEAQSIGILQSIMLQSRGWMTTSDVGLAQQNRATPASLSCSDKANSVALP